jgi:hypothetical protein
MNASILGCNDIGSEVVWMRGEAQIVKNPGQASYVWTLAFSTQYLRKAYNRSKKYIACGSNLLIR